MRLLQNRTDFLSRCAQYFLIPFCSKFLTCILIWTPEAPCGCCLCAVLFADDHQDAEEEPHPSWAVRCRQLAGSEAARLSSVRNVNKLKPCTHSREACSSHCSCNCQRQKLLDMSCPLGRCMHSLGLPRACDLQHNEHFSLVVRILFNFTIQTNTSHETDETLGVSRRL